MALLTLIARVSDGLPLSASILNDEVREKYSRIYAKILNLCCYSLAGMWESIKPELSRSLENFQTSLQEDVPLRVIHWYFSELKCSCVANAPIIVMPHYPPCGQCRGICRGILPENSPRGYRIGNQHIP